MYLIGKNAIFEVYKKAKKSFICIYTHKPHDPFLQQFEGIPVQFKDKDTLSRIANSESHQGFVAKIKPKSFVTPHDLFQKDLIVALDEIQDPQNLGAILRACECFGVEGVIFSKNRGSGLTPVVAKTSQGALEILDLCEVSNLATTIDQFKKQDFEVIGADLSQDAHNVFDFSFPKKCVLVLGKESGMRHLLKKKCDQLVYIPMFGQIDSLNVSQATAALLAFYRAFFAS